MMRSALLWSSGGDVVGHQFEDLVVPAHVLVLEELFIDGEEYVVPQVLLIVPSAEILPLQHSLFL